MEQAAADAKRRAQVLSTGWIVGPVKLISVLPQVNAKTEA
jgi:hypothetical protein